MKDNRDWVRTCPPSTIVVESNTYSSSFSALVSVIDADNSWSGSDITPDPEAEFKWKLREEGKALEGASRCHCWSRYAILRFSHCHEISVKYIYYFKSCFRLVSRGVGERHHDLATSGRQL
jgi:hypothetical protein